jgi:small subunit ribosomal protein S8e
MTQWHGDQIKRKVSGGRRKSYRKKRLYEKGRDPTKTILGDSSNVVFRTRGGNQKVRLLRAKYVNVSIPSKKTTQKVEITGVLSNPANTDYNRAEILTKGAIIQTPLGDARVVSRPSQDGLVNAILIDSAKK